MTMHQRFFFIKFETFKDLDVAIHKGICRLPSKAFLAKMIKEILNTAYETAEIILIFSVTGSHGIQGFGRMISEAKRRFFGIRVLTFLSDNCLPLKNLSKMPNPLHRNIPVAESQFGHELPPYIGIKVCSLVEELYQEAKLTGAGGFWNPLSSNVGVDLSSSPPTAFAPVARQPQYNEGKENNITADSNSFFYFHPAHYIRATEQPNQALCDHSDECYSVFQRVNVKQAPFAKRCPFCDRCVYDYEYIYQEVA